MEERETLLFQVSKEIKAMFDLTILLSGQDKNVVFETFVREFAAKTLTQRSHSPPPFSKPLATNSYEQTHACKNVLSDERDQCKQNFSDFNLSKAIRRIPLWANRPSQFNHQIIKSFFACEKNDSASRKEMKKIFLKNTRTTTEWQFENNLNSMLTEEGNSHGHVFDCEGDRVTIAKNALEILYQYKNHFN